ncbi:27841_t:CDS:2, partial [Gigaspora margarita]
MNFCHFSGVTCFQYINTSYLVLELIVVVVLGACYQYIDTSFL